MSVFTPVSDAEARALLEHYTLGELEKLEGIAQGVENTNYFLTTTTGEYVLTLFEHIPRGDLPFYVGLMDHLAHHDVTCPAPMRMDNGELIAEVNGKPACIVTKPAGRRARTPTRTCAGAPARSSRASTSPRSTTTPPSRTGAGARGASFAEAVQPKLSRAENELIAAENRYQAIHDDSVLPQGIIHGDFFHDNVLWDDEGEGGVIDFYFACDDALAYDLAIAVNDWCVNADATLDPARAHAFIAGYETLRPLESFEREPLAGDAAARGAAHVAGAPGLQPFPARLAHDDPQGPRVLAPPARAPHRARAQARGHARLGDGREHQGRRAQGLARGARWIVEAFTLFRRAPLAWIGLCAGWIAITFALILIPFIGGVIANFLQPVFFASFAIAAFRQAAGERLVMGDLFAGFKRNMRALVNLGALLLLAEIAIFALMALLGLPMASSSEHAFTLGEYVEELKGKEWILATGFLLTVAVKGALWFAPPLIAFHGMTTVQAIRWSVYAAIANLGAMMVYGAPLLGDLLPRAHPLGARASSS